MKKKNKLAMFDLDGTLFDTKNVNFRAYSQALEECGFDVKIDYKYYCDFCNGNSYRVFLPVIIPGISESEMESIHKAKKKAYIQHINYARINVHLFSLIRLMRSEYTIALVTTASKVNTMDILSAFSVKDLFDLIITQEDVSKPKPSPEGFLKAVELTAVEKGDSIIFEDSTTGLQAAKASNINYVQVYGFN